MNKRRVLINDFSLGVISRRLQGDAEMLLATRAAEKIENGYITPDGGVSRRPASGMVYPSFLTLSDETPWNERQGGQKVFPTFDAFRDTSADDANEQLKVVTASRSTVNVDILEMHTGIWNPVLKEAFLPEGSDRDSFIEVYKKVYNWIDFFEYWDGTAWVDPSNAQTKISGTSEAAIPGESILIQQEKLTPTTALRNAKWYCKKTVTGRIRARYRVRWVDEGSWWFWDNDVTHYQGVARVEPRSGKHSADSGWDLPPTYIYVRALHEDHKGWVNVTFLAGYTYRANTVNETGAVDADMQDEYLQIEIDDGFDKAWGTANWVGGAESTVVYDITQAMPLDQERFKMKRNVHAKVTAFSDHGEVILSRVSGSSAGGSVTLIPIVSSRDGGSQTEIELVKGAQYRVTSNGPVSGAYRFYLELTERLEELDRVGPEPERYSPVRMTKTDRFGFVTEGACWFFRDDWSTAYSRAIKFAADVLGRTAGFDGDTLYLSKPYGEGEDAPDFPDYSDYDIKVKLSRPVRWIDSGDQLYIGNGETESYLGAPMGFYTNQAGGIVLKNLTQGGAKAARANQYGLFYLLQDNTLGVATERRVIATDDYLDRSEIIEFSAASDKGGLALLALDEEKNLWMSRFGENGFAWWILDTDVLWYALWGNEIMVAKQRGADIGIEMLPVLDGMFFRRANRMDTIDLADGIFYRRYAKDGISLLREGFIPHNPPAGVATMAAIEYLATGETIDHGYGYFQDGEFVWSDGSGKTENNIVDDGEIRNLYFIPLTGAGIDNYQRPKLYIKTLPLHIPSVYGSSLHDPQRITDVVVSVDSTRGIRVRSGDGEWEERTFEAPYTGTLAFSVNSGYDVEVTVEIESIGNLPLHVQKIQADVIIGDT